MHSRIWIVGIDYIFNGALGVFGHRDEDRVHVRDVLYQRAETNGLSWNRVPISEPILCMLVKVMMAMLPTMLAMMLVPIMVTIMVKVRVMALTSRLTTTFAEDLPQRDRPHDLS